MRTTTYRSRWMAIAVVGAVLAPTFAVAETLLAQNPFAQNLTRATRASSMVQERAAAPTIRPGEFYAAPYVERDGGPPNAGEIVGTAEVAGIPLTERDRPLQSYERIFITVPPGMSSAPGARYVAVRNGPALEGVGQVVIPTGIIVVERAQAGQALEGRIVARFEPMYIGDQLVSMEPAPSNLPRPVARANGVQTRALWFEGELVLPSLQSYVVIAGGSAAGMRPGDQITFYRESRVGGDGITLPETSIAIAQIIRVTAQASTAMIIDQTHASLEPGTVARVTAKMP